MKIKLFGSIVVLFFLSAIASAQDGTDALKDAAAILVGKWKVEGRETYESWERDGAALKGKGFRVRNGVETVTETLEIREIDGTVYYVATIAGQNNGAAVKFRLSESAADKLVFENPEHDFPKRIAYQRRGEDLTAAVSGTEGKGFSMKFRLVTPSDPK
jgi:hypothetical protein